MAPGRHRRPRQRRLRPDGRQSWAFAASLALAPAVLAGGIVLALTAGQQGPAAPSHAAAETATTTTTAQTLETATAPEPQVGRTARPIRLRVPSVGIDAAVVPTGANANEIIVPPVSRIGWFDGGPRPGEPGRTILIAHIDSLDGPAAFTGLPDVSPGASVTAVSSDGTERSYEVSRTMEVSKTNFAADRVYAPTADSTLVLITCTGSFDPETGYDDNFIAFARPV